MQPISFPGAVEIKKPENMTDEECMSVWATQTLIYDEDGKGHIMYAEAWKPSYEDIKAINRGELIYIQIHSIGLPPIAVFTLDENGNSNDAD